MAAPFWPLVHGKPRVELPALPQFVELLEARGTPPEVTRVTGERRHWADRDELLGFLRRQLWTTPGSPADERLLATLDSMVVAGDDDSVAIRGASPLDIGIVSWSPTESR